MMLTNLMNELLTESYDTYKTSLVYFSFTLVMIPLISKTVHPVTMMFYLMLFSSTVCLKMSLIYKNSWFSYMLFLSMVGGMLVMFLYFVSTTPNEPNSISKKEMNHMLTMMISTLMIMLMIMYFFDSFTMISVENNFNMNLTMNIMPWSNYINFNSFQMYSLNYKTTLLVMIYLLFTLYSLLKMCMKYYGPLRQRY
uniref:NADH dehydrogenase subunit 6 n=1 Tax=Janus megamaculatus TaxID=2876199 RepID=A0A8K1TP23_9HYME|nr:NADH dehydrogenase subunit 6 [Janus megamaculatus]